MTPEDLKAVETAAKAVHSLRNKHKDKFKQEDDFKIFLDHKGTFVTMYAHAKTKLMGYATVLFQADLDKSDQIKQMITSLEGCIEIMAETIKNERSTQSEGTVSQT